MTTKEFSDAFDTLLASYNHKSEFGDQASYADVTLDEYEKSVFLTQAQDNVVKNYFDNRANSLAEGFDDSIRRQADFSSLITVANPTPVGAGSSTWNTGNSMFHNTINTLTGSGNSYAGYKISVIFGEAADSVQTATEAGVFVITCAVSAETAPTDFFTENLSGVNNGGIIFQTTDPTQPNYLGVMTISTAISNGSFTITSYPTGTTDAYDSRGILYNLPSNVLLMLNERIKSTDNKYYVVVPISYKEYDRQMSRAYAQPLKKQCWRLFEGESSTNTVSEVIPKEGVSVSLYRIRYIRRPNPIILTDLGFSTSQEPLEIDGHRTVTECELNPILHMDILEEAVRLALNSKGIETRDQKAAREAAKRS